MDKEHKTDEIQLAEVQSAEAEELSANSRESVEREILPSEKLESVEQEILPSKEMDTEAKPRRKKKKKKPVHRRGRNYSRGYLIGSLIYWGVLLALVIAFRDEVIGIDVTKQEAGRTIFQGLIATVIASALISIGILYPRLQVRKSGKPKRLQMYPWHLLWMIAADVFAFFIIEYVNNPDFSEMEIRYKLLNIAGILIINLILFLWLNSLKLSIIIVLFFWGVISIVFYYVYAFRGEPLQLIDFFSIATAMTVAGSYEFVIPRAVVVDAALSLSLIGLAAHMQHYVLIRKGRIKKILMRVLVLIIMIAMYPFYLTVNWNGSLGILTDLFAPIKTYKEYGTTVGFFCVAKYMRLTAPEDYSVDETETVAEASLQEQEPNTVTTVKPVNIIAIMNESWADYRYVGDLQTNEPVMPYYDSLTENTIKGHTLVCIRGGGTAKTEYEFLTGNSVKRFPGMVPYVSYFTHEQYSLVTTLEAQGYQTAAMHPYKGSNWKRTAAYQLMDFDTFYTQDDFDADVLKYHNHISDQANYEKIIEVINNKESSDQPFFLFDITMQNHGGYTANDVKQTITVDGYDNDVVNRYLSLEKLSDDALQYLIEYFEDYEEPTLIVMFGDHYPTLPDEFTEYISGEKYDDLEIEDQMRYYSTPFLIWANYDIPEADGIITSTNYLGTLMLEQTGLEMADYNYYLKNLSKSIPALNHLGYMDSNGEYHTWDDGDENSLKLEWEYECLQYNNLAEKRNRMEWFFGMEDGSE